LPAGGKPLIVWHIERLARAGFRELVINHAHLGQEIEAMLGDGLAWGVSIAYSDEGTALETAGGIANALPILGQDPFLVVNGDVYCDYDFARLKALNLGNDHAYLVLVPNPAHHPGGDFFLEQGRVVDGGEPRFTFSGIGLYRPELFLDIPLGTPAKLAPLLRSAMAQGRVGGEYFAGRWLDIGTPQRLAELDAELSRTD
jgi:MurNAc alpha-1-phosphate uridylyltransferase